MKAIQYILTLLCLNIFCLVSLSTYAQEVPTNPNYRPILTPPTTTTPVQNPDNPPTKEGEIKKEGEVKKEGENTTTNNENKEETPNEVFEDEMEMKQGRDGYLANAYIDNLQIYGSELFRNSYSFGKTLTNRPTPLNYSLGPGDQLLVDITGINVVSFAPTVQPDGSISLREFGKVFVGGKSIDEAREIIKGRLNSNNFSIDKGSSLDVNITNVRSFTITVMGQVVNPGAKIVGTFNTVLDALNLAGGITSIGSYRYVRLIRNNQIYAEIDLYEMIVNADFSSNFFLQDNDIIEVPVYRDRIALTGEVKRQAWYELKRSETLWDIITKYAGGFTAQAYTNIIKATQFTDEQKRIRDIKFEDLTYFNPINGDKYFVDKILDRVENRVSIQGAVTRPGSFELETTPTLLKLIEKAGGLEKGAFTSRAYLTRTNPENGAYENISIDLEGILSKKLPDIVLEREDVLYIKSIFEMTDRSTVIVAGKVHNPGVFNYFKGMTIEDVIMLSNGFEDGANFQAIQVSRRVKDSDPKAKDAKLSEIFTISVDPYLRISDHSFLLEPYDIISVLPLKNYTKQVMVKIEGEVLLPGTFSLTKKDDRISDLLNRAGGFTELADVRGATLYRPSRNITSNEGLLDNYRKSLRTTENKVDFVQEGIGNEGAKVDETKIQLDPNLIALDLDYILKYPGSNRDLILLEGDVLSIPRQNYSVEIRGQVGFPTIAVYDKRKDLLDYINDDAGGFTDNANKRRTKVEYRNGRSSSKKFFGKFPEIEPGAIIYVPPKVIKEKEKFDFQSFIAITSSLASTAAIIFSVIKLYK